MYAIASFQESRLGREMVRELRSDHAGECGAVQIYRGILAVSRDDEVRRFAQRHLETEIEHRQFFERWLPARYHSRLLPVWRVAGWSLGAAAAWFGRRVVFQTISAVESFVDRHYLDQIQALSDRPDLQGLSTVLRSFREDELEHRDEALDRLDKRADSLNGWWPRMVGWGSLAGVMVARRV